jgi:succinate-semialdehyde dehydrogenase/glutarate-semialdehyde dehydrogenase
MKLKNPSLLQTDAFIDNQWVKTGKTFAVFNPATGETVANVADCGVEETKHAIKAAEIAFQSWQKSNVKDRAKVLKKWHDLMLANLEDLAAIMTAEQGKPLAEARGEIAYAASFLEWFGEEAKRAYGDIIPSPIPNSRIMVIRQPIGVCASITPWNFPSAMLTRKAGPAIAAGCSIVSKPAGETPLSALALGVLAIEAGLPPGVFNVIPSSRSSDIGKELCSNPVVRKLSFTGSTAVGKILMRQSADTIKKLSLELGGNAPFIVFEDANIDKAVEAAISCKFRNAGQTCVCANRIYIQESIYEEFAEKFTAKAKMLKVGNGAEQGINLGPLISEKAIQKVQEHIQDAVAKGGKVLLGGKPHELGGLFFEQTVIGNASKNMLVATDETFGPMAPLFRFKDEADVMAQANDTIYGLAAYFFSADMAKIWRVAEGLEYGMVAVNTGILSTEVAPFGGIKQSGLGREGSKYGLDEYLEMKYILIGGL